MFGVTVITRQPTAIAKSGGRVVVETLNVSGMMRNRRLERAIADAGMSGFLLVEAGVQVRLVRSRVREGGPVVCVVEDCAHMCGWNREARDLTLADR